MAGLWGTLILLLLLILMLALVPTWPYSRRWGYYPGAIVGALLLLWILLIWFGYVAVWYPWRPAAVVEAPVVVEEPVPGAVD